MPPMENDQTPLLLNNSSPASFLRRKRQGRGQPRRWGWPLFIALFLVLPVLSILLLRSRRAVVPLVIDHDFGVGFDLTSPYGTAAISYPNGTVVNVVKIDASYSYQATMHKLSLESSRYLHPPYRELDQAFRDYPRQLVRRALKGAGLPASFAVSNLAYQILALRSAVESRLGRKISGAVAAIPHLPALYQEDLQDAFEYAGLIYVADLPYWTYPGLSETAGVYAANGFGLCANYTDPASCKDQGPNMPNRPHHENVLSVSYTRNMLTSTWAPESHGYATPESEWFIKVDFNLGWEQRDRGPKQEDYWAAVRDAIIWPALQENVDIRREANKVLTYGDRALEDRFQVALRQAVYSGVISSDAVIFHADPVFSAARGAAEFAKRAIWTYNHTGGPY